MQSTKKYTLLWLLSGLLLGLLVLLVVFSGLSGNVWITDPEGIPETVNALLTCIQTGNWEDMEDLVAGNPVLRPATGVAISAEGILWEAFQRSLQWQCTEEISVQDEYVTQCITITCLDIPGAVHTMEEILKDTSNDEDPMHRSKILSETAQQVLNAGAPFLTREITLTLHREQGQWLVVPDRALLTLMSGFITT